MSYIDTQYESSMSDLQLIKPCLERLLMSEIAYTDKESDPIHALLDQIAGIDALAKRPDNKIQTLALRLQRGKNWGTFTIRSRRVTGNDTELQKWSADNLAVHPTHFCQIYIEGPRIWVGLARYDDLFAYVKMNETVLQKRTANGEGNEFIVVDWDNLKDFEWMHLRDEPCEECRRA